MAGVVVGMESALKSMNLEKVCSRTSSCDCHVTASGVVALYRVTGCSELS